MSCFIFRRLCCQLQGREITLVGPVRVHQGRRDKKQNLLYPNGEHSFLLSGFLAQSYFSLTSLTNFSLKMVHNDVHGHDFVISDTIT